MHKYLKLFRNKQQPSWVQTNRHDFATIQHLHTTSVSILDLNHFSFKKQPLYLSGNGVHRGKNSRADYLGEKNLNGRRSGKFYSANTKEFQRPQRMEHCSQRPPTKELHLKSIQFEIRQLWRCEKN